MVQLFSVYLFGASFFMFAPDRAQGIDLGQASMCLGVFDKDGNVGIAQSAGVSRKELYSGIVSKVK